MLCADTRLLENPYYFMGVRDYDDNDTFSKINWNATAAMGRMMSAYMRIGECIGYSLYVNFLTGM